MFQKIKVTGITFLIIISIIGCAPKDNYPKELDSLTLGASLVFKAKVLVLHSTTTDEDDVSNTGVATVTEVIEAPESFSNISGQQITIRFADINKVNVGEEKIFFTEPYWIGEAIGVEEKGSVSKSSELYNDKEMSSHLKRARDNQDDEQLKNALKEAKLVITGKVAKINEVQGKITGLTEHDPEWKEAEVEVDETIKGNNEGKTVKILFASGKDVMFFQAPKFQPGDEGIFIIQQTDKQTAKQLKNDNMIIEPIGFIKGKEKVKRIKSLLK